MAHKSCKKCKIQKNEVDFYKDKGRFKSICKDLGCSIEEFKAYIESLFQPGMTWGNWGKGNNKWHIDHIRPISSFDLSDRDQLKKACHYSNLQPLWEVDNLIKGAKWHLKQI